MNALLSTLRTRPLLCDGGMGTQLMLRGLASGACGEAWNIEQPAKVREVHAAYRAAGCDLLTTNTFGGSRPALAKHHQAEQLLRLNQAGASVARQACDGAFVLGDIGPLGEFLEPLGDLTLEQAADFFTEQATALRQGGADGVIVETMADPTELACAVRAARALGDWPVLATFAYQSADAQSFHTMMGAGVDHAVKSAVEAGASVVGANCGTDLSLDAYLRLTEQLAAAAGDIPVIVQPNAGKPHVVGDRTEYPATPSDMAAYVPRLLAAGARIVGGCCGTTPAHLAAMKRLMPKA